MITVLVQKLEKAGFNKEEIEKIRKNSECYLSGDNEYLDVCVSCCIFPQCISLNFCERFCKKWHHCDNYALYSDILKLLNNEE